MEEKLKKTKVKRKVIAAVVAQWFIILFCVIWSVHAVERIDALEERVSSLEQAVEVPTGDPVGDLERESQH